MVRQSQPNKRKWDPRSYNGSTEKIILGTGSNSTLGNEFKAPALFQNSVSGAIDPLSDSKH